MTLTLNFQGEIWNLLYLTQKWSDCLETKSKHIDLALSLKCNHLIWHWPWPWPWIFKVKYGIRYIYLSQKRSDCHKTKSEHIDWTLSLKCDHWIWPWLWPWPRIFKVKYGICYISPKMVRLPWNKKQTYWFTSMSQMWPSDLTLVMILTMNFQGQICKLPYLSQRWFDCHIVKSMHIEWIEGLNDHQVWPWPWLWKVGCKHLLDSDRGDFRCRRAIDSSS